MNAELMVPVRKRLPRPAGRPTPAWLLNLGGVVILTEPSWS